jgi:hypothetical protein
MGEGERVNLHPCFRKVELSRAVSSADKAELRLAGYCL